MPRPGTKWRRYQQRARTAVFTDSLEMAGLHPWPRYTMPRVTATIAAMNGWFKAFYEGIDIPDRFTAVMNLRTFYG